MNDTLLLLLLVLGMSCSEKEEEPPAEQNQFAVCNERLLLCSGSLADVDYCLFGFKYGADNDFAIKGKNVIGPKKKGGTVTYSLQENLGFVNTHSELNVPTEPLGLLPRCARDDIDRALEAYASVADIDFEKLPPNSDSDIKFFAADIEQGGLGKPNFNEGVCQEISGHVILNPTFITDCDDFYLFVLHEIGHALGLGHASANTVMGTIRGGWDGLQAGDIEGIRQIYGAR